MPPLLGAEGNGLRGPLLVGSIAAFIAAYLAIRCLVRYFENRTLVPFAVYCALAGLGGLAYLAIGGPDDPGDSVAGQGEIGGAPPTHPPWVVAGVLRRYRPD
ncbi:undecaprenyl-diphosphate phosphatase [Streptomyces sp. NPDC050549]|uniref:undecaprenyl-diphosphate phosphatase n=1 Tax=Streptomyces sp. NPDC050549 TaxID=3155406 RepID=UPI0034466F6F